VKIVNLDSNYRTKHNFELLEGVLHRLLDFIVSDRQNRVLDVLDGNGEGQLT
jgi:hypothetical protein